MKPLSQPPSGLPSSYVQELEAKVQLLSNRLHAVHSAVGGGMVDGPGAQPPAPSSGKQAKRPGVQQVGGKLVGKYGAPPFSTLDAKQGYWQERNRQWKQLGIDSGQGRDEALLGVDACARCRRD